MRQRRLQPHPDRLGQRPDGRSADHHQVVAQSEQRAQQRSGVGAHGDTRGAFALGLGAHRIQSHQGLADAVLDTVQRVHVETLRQAGQQLAQRPRHPIERTGGGFGDLAMGARRQQQKRNHQPGDAAERHLKHAVKCRSDRTGVGYCREAAAR